MDSTTDEAQKVSVVIGSSLFLQMTIFFGKWFDFLYFIVLFLSWIFKTTNLPYPAGSNTFEFIFILLYICIEIGRYYLCSMGNKTEQPSALGWSFLILGFAVFANFYFSSLQIFVLRIDSIICTSMYVFQCLHLVFGLLAFVSFRRHSYV
eukprot:TRINITY_DN867_c0_g1_i1.p1 TRINITY_DN867_c0_g1~~TRINITY_DN867_c0_g1_i1.p1  ORF type:complete len:150 (-),score=26.80 TRINITY_DN867_c0_g1_i1:123-572(-)